VTDAQYFALIRNFRRHSWLPIISVRRLAAVCRASSGAARHSLVELSPGTMYAPHATSLRMGPLGYQSDAQSALYVSYNDLKSYSASLDEALTKPYPPYAKVGIRTTTTTASYRPAPADRERVLRHHPSQAPHHSGERRAARPAQPRRRVRRSAPDGPRCVLPSASGRRPALVDVFLLHCLLADSPPDTPQEIAAIRATSSTSALRGRGRIEVAERFRSS